MRPTIREATLDDADALARLRWEFRIEAGTPATRDYDGFLQEFRVFAADALADDTPWRAWVADDDGSLVGCAWLQIVAKVPHPGRTLTERPIAYVTNMFVDAGHRNLGLGGELLERAVAFARDRDADGVVLWPSERSRPFYERAGFGPEPLWLPLAGD